MSLALIGCQPRTLDPSKAIPSSNSASFKRVAGIVVCCQIPGKSMNLRSTNLTSFFCASSRTSFAFIWTGSCSNRVLAALPGADAHGLFDGRNEDLSVPDPPRLCALLDRVEDVVHER